MKFRKPIFNRKHDFVVLKTLRLTSKLVLQIGDVIKFGDYRNYRLLRWYRMGRIAKNNSDYANEFLRCIKLKNKINYLEELPETKVNGYYEVNTKDPLPIVQSHYQPVLAIKEVEVEVKKVAKKRGRPSKNKAKK